MIGQVARQETHISSCPSHVISTAHDLTGHALDSFRDELARLAKIVHSPPLGSSPAHSSSTRMKGAALRTPPVTPIPPIPISTPGTTCRSSSRMPATVPHMTSPAPL